MAKHLISILIIILTSSIGGAYAKGQERRDATALFFSEQSAEGQASQTRMIITPAYLRIDGGVDGNGFILFDRVKPAIYSVTISDKTILVIAPLKVNLRPPVPFINTIKINNASYPKVTGHKLVHYQMITNGTRCFDVFAARDLLPEPLAALRQYAQLLAGEQAQAMEYTPKDMQTACDLANNIFLPTRHLDQGFPVRQQDMAGNTRQLINYDEHYPFDPKLFVLPAGFKRYTTQEMRGDTK